MTDGHGHPRSDRRRRWATAVVAAVLLIASAAALVIASVPHPSGPAPQPDASHGVTAGESYRPSFHLSPAAHWMNDPQRPFRLGGLWHFYYLYNKDYPTGNGTEWRHLTSPDLVHWTDRGTAIEKYTNGLGDIETGSTVVDHDGTAGHGRDAVIAIVTQQSDGVQRQSLFYSTDGGYHFASDAANPIMENPGVRDWRDPKIVRDAAHGRWVIVLAEGTKLGFYTSPDLRSWTYRSGMQTAGIGTVECPDLFPLDLDGDPGRPVWVLAASANRSASGGTTGFAYWTGGFDGESFVPDRAEPAWLDAGPDFYAAVTWAEPGSTSKRYALGWMNNWAYARTLPTTGWYGADTVLRELRLTSGDGAPRLSSVPLPAATRPAGGAVSSMTAPNAARTIALPREGTVVTAELESQARPGGGALRLRIGGTGGSHVDLLYDPRHGELTLDRAHDAFATSARAPAAYRSAAKAPIVARDGVVRLTILIDRSSVELFTSDGSSLTALTFLEGGARSISVANGLTGPVTVGVSAAAPARG
ncbi:GH32 C-terminal domain-containing protein [Leifsonia sp. P73]|uniref:GH32 C-terminal domain-containing protein n=1 Tax=Leifsonia sp. P73 TaxID=3423959 RepID=UPI003DA4891B